MLNDPKGIARVLAHRTTWCPQEKAIQWRQSRRTSTISEIVAHRQTTKSHHNSQRDCYRASKKMNCICGLDQSTPPGDSGTERLRLGNLFQPHETSKIKILCIDETLSAANQAILRDFNILESHNYACHCGAVVSSPAFPLATLKSSMMIGLVLRIREAGNPGTAFFGPHGRRILVFQLLSLYTEDSLHSLRHIPIVTKEPLAHV